VRCGCWWGGRGVGRQRSKGSTVAFPLGFADIPSVTGAAEKKTRRVYREDKQLSRLRDRWPSPVKESPPNNRWEGGSFRRGKDSAGECTRAPGCHTWQICCTPDGTGKRGSQRSLEKTETNSTTVCGGVSLLQRSFILIQICARTAVWGAPSHEVPYLKSF